VGLRGQKQAEGALDVRQRRRGGDRAPLSAHDDTLDGGPAGAHDDAREVGAVGDERERADVDVRGAEGDVPPQGVVADDEGREGVLTREQASDLKRPVTVLGRGDGGHPHDAAAGGLNQAAQGPVRDGQRALQDAGEGVGGGRLAPDLLVAGQRGGLARDDVDGGLAPALGQEETRGWDELQGVGPGDEAEGESTVGAGDALCSGLPGDDAGAGVAIVRGAAEADAADEDACPGGERELADVDRGADADAEERRAGPETVEGGDEAPIAGTDLVEGERAGGVEAHGALRVAIDLGGQRDADVGEQSGREAGGQKNAAPHGARGLHRHRRVGVVGVVGRNLGTAGEGGKDPRKQAREEHCHPHDTTLHRRHPIAPPHAPEARTAPLRGRWQVTSCRGCVASHSDARASRNDAAIAVARCAPRTHDAGRFLLSSMEVGRGEHR
jgi:hypothetical protein